MAQSKERKILDHAAVGRAIKRIAYEIVERNRGIENLALVGIRTGGEGLTDRLCRTLDEIEGVEVPCGFMDITLYRDDVFHVQTQPVVRKTEIDFPVQGKIVVLVDDVIYTGRSVRSAMDGLMDMGRPKAIQLAVLIDRGHRELPIRPDFVGRNIPTERGDRVKVVIKEDMGKSKKDKVVVIEGQGKPGKKKKEGA